MPGGGGGGGGEPNIAGEILKTVFIIFICILNYQKRV